jgi:DNA-directed RNA polymerase subunit M/transcription elongation factor TFIIS
MSEVSPMKAAKILNKNVKQGIVKKSDVRNMGVKVSENDEYDKMLSNQLGQKCPKCKKFHASGGSSLKVLNPSNPTVYQCGHCGNKWNPDNDTSNITKVGDKSVLGQPVAEAKITHLQKLIRETVSEILKEVAPGGWEGNVDTTKKHPQINNPSSLSNYIKSNVR